MFSTSYQPLVPGPHALGRVVAHDRGFYSVATETGEFRAAVTGKLHHAAAQLSDFPVVGDFVEIRKAESDSATASIVSVLPRSNLFARRAAGGEGTLAPIAANLDRLFVTLAVNEDFNLRRLERYLVAAAAFGVPVAVALTKIDLVDDPLSFVVGAESIAGGVPVVALCAAREGGLQPLVPFRGPGRTLGFVGSSGVGKSTLVNTLLGAQHLPTGGIRDDGRGRHTTTRRELLFLADGTAVIDTPGMREFRLADASDGIGSSFGDVSGRANACRFRNCRHESEPGCAVRDEIDPERLASFRKLQREAAFEARKADPELARASQARWKAIGRAARAHYKNRGR